MYIRKSKKQFRRHRDSDKRMIHASLNVPPRRATTITRSSNKRQTSLSSTYQLSFTQALSPSLSSTLTAPTFTSTFYTPTSGFALDAPTRSPSRRERGRGCSLYGTRRHFAGAEKDKRFRRDSTAEVNVTRAVLWETRDPGITDRRTRAEDRGSREC